MTIGTRQSSKGYPTIATVALMKTQSYQTDIQVRTISKLVWTTTPPTGGGLYNIVSAADHTTITGDGTPDEVRDYALVNGNVAMWDDESQEIGVDIQAWDTQLDDIAALSVTDGNIIVGDGTNWIAESGATARTSLGLGTGDNVTFTNVIGTGTLGVTGISTLGVINASGLASLNAGIDVDGVFTVADTTGNIITTGTLGVTGIATFGDDIVSDTDSTDDLGTTGVRWANLWVDDITATTSAVINTTTISTGSIIDSSGAISFGDENLSTTGTLGAGASTFTGNVILTSATGVLGYATGAGGAVTQGTSRTTGVTVNTPAGAISMFSAAGSATAATFTVTNSSVAATDTIMLSVKSATNLYNVIVTAVTAGTFDITFYTTGGTATDAPVINYSIISAVVA